MAKYGSSSIAISVDDAPGGSLRDMSQYVREIGGVKIENILEVSHAFGDSWEEMLATGFARIPAIPLSGLFDDTATTGPHVVFQVKAADRSPSAATRTFTFAVGANSFTCEGHMASYEVTGRNGNLTAFAAVFQPSGSGAWS